MILYALIPHPASNKHTCDRNNDRYPPRNPMQPLFRFLDHSHAPSLVLRPRRLAGRVSSIFPNRSSSSRSSSSAQKTPAAAVLPPVVSSTNPSFHSGKQYDCFGRKLLARLSSCIITQAMLHVAPLPAGAALALVRPCSVGTHYHVVRCVISCETDGIRSHAA